MIRCLGRTSTSEKNNINYSSEGFEHSFTFIVKEISMKTEEMFSRTFQLILVCSLCWMPTEQAVASEYSLHSVNEQSLVDTLLLEEREAMFPGDFLTPYRYHTPRGPRARGRREASGDACESMVQGEGLDVEVANVSRVPGTGFEWKRLAEDVEFERVRSPGRGSSRCPLDSSRQDGCSRVATCGSSRWTRRDTATTCTKRRT